MTPAILGAKAAAEFIGVSRAHLYIIAKQPDFPKARRVSEGRVGWLSKELEAWAESRPTTTEPVRPARKAKAKK